ncbi:MAG: hypothetical protein MHMPM18_001664 [Marteilia pararefringens]
MPTAAADSAMTLKDFWEINPYSKTFKSFVNLYQKLHETHQIAAARDLDTLIDDKAKPFTGKLDRTEADKGVFCENNVNFSAETMKKLKELEVPRNTKVLVIQIDESKILYRCIQFLGSMSEYTQVSQSTQYYNLKYLKNSEDFMAYFMKSTRWYCREKVPREFLRYINRIPVAIYANFDTVQISDCNVLIRNFRDNCCFPRSFENLNMYFEFMVMFGLLTCVKFNFFFLNFSPRGPCNMIGTEILPSSNREDINCTAHFSFFDEIQVDKYNEKTAERNVYRISYTGFGNTHDGEQFEVLKPFLAPYELELFENASDDFPDPFAFICCPSRFPKLMWKFIESQEEMKDIKMPTIDKMNIEAVQDFIINNQADQIGLMPVEVFNILKPKLRVEARRLINRAAMLSALTLVSSLQSYFYNDLEPKLEKSQPQEIILSLNMDKAHRAVFVAAQFEKLCNSYMKLFWKKSSIYPLFPTLRFLSTPKSQTIGACAITLLKMKEKYGLTEFLK